MGQAQKFWPHFSSRSSVKTGGRKWDELKSFGPTLALVVVWEMWWKKVGQAQKFWPHFSSSSSVKSGGRKWDKLKSFGPTLALVVV